MVSSAELEPYIYHCQVMVKDGKDIEDILRYLRKELESKVSSMFVVMQLLNIPPGEAKKLVHFSRTWNDVKERDENFQEEIFSALEALEKKNHLE
jgi:hypothetical protein